MKYFSRFNKLCSALLAVSVSLVSCSSATLIQSTPSGAKLYLNGEVVGWTPYLHRDTKIIGSTTTVRLEKDGYEIFYTSFTRDEEVDIGAIIGGILVFIPFLWTMRYKPARTYELVPLGAATSTNSIKLPVQQQPVKSKMEKLRELKQLLDEKIITQEEYEREKKKILEETER